MSLASQISTSQAYRTSRGPDNDNVPLLLRINTHKHIQSRTIDFAISQRWKTMCNIQVNNMHFSSSKSCRNQNSRPVRFRCIVRHAAQYYPTAPTIQSIHKQRPIIRLICSSVCDTNPHYNMCNTIFL